MKGEPAQEGAVILAGASTSGQARRVPYDPFGILQPGSPENEEWTRNTMRLLRELGHVFHSEPGDGESQDDGKDVEVPDLPANPDDLLRQGWEEITHPDAAAEGRRTFRNKETGLVVHADKGESGKSGFRGRDHYHVDDPNRTGKRDYYLDGNGRPVAKGSKPSHVLSGEKP